MITDNSSRATWLKLGLAMVAMAVALVIFRLGFASAGGVFLTAFGSFISVVALAIAMYYGALFVLARRAHRPD